VEWDLPEEFGPWEAASKRHHRFCLHDTQDRTLTTLQVHADAAGELDGVAGVDSSIRRVHQHGATAVRPGGRAGTAPPRAGRKVGPADHTGQ
jgi:hypothetical protein